MKAETTQHLFECACCMAEITMRAEIVLNWTPCKTQRMEMIFPLRPERKAMLA
jgi:hypothetical protein